MYYIEFVIRWLRLLVQFERDIKYETSIPFLVLGESMLRSCLKTFSCFIYPRFELHEFSFVSEKKNINKKK